MSQGCESRLRFVVVEFMFLPVPDQHGTYQVVNISWTGENTTCDCQNINLKHMNNCCIIEVIVWTVYFGDITEFMFL